MIDLSSLRSPSELKNLGVEQLLDLVDEIRSRIISVCLKNGGHIGASLGTVELTVALHRIFDSPKDAIIWDVGHQAYAHKLITGRAARFDTLRVSGGISGFLSRQESEHDIFGAGHSSTALSAALGYSYRNTDWSIAVIGDGGLTAGVALEALNNFSSVDSGPLLVVLNDNQMSISENVGGLHQILSKGGAQSFFELFGMEYVGPIDGHDLPTLLGTLNGIRSNYGGRPILLHVLTQKGKGYAPAETRPSAFHGVGPMQKTADKALSASESVTQTWSDLFCSTLMELAASDPRIVAITAAMGEGTGLLPFAKKYPDRFFDVGIAEPHAVTFAAGLAARGWKPVVAIYSTFLQRAIDPMIHDVALQNLPVVFAVDRAGLVGADGPTHHGSFDLVFTRMIPGFRMYVPEADSDLKELLSRAFDGSGPAMIRYPRGKAETKVGTPTPVGDFYAESKDPSRVSKVVITIGPIGSRVARLIEKKALAQTVEHLRLLQVKPFSELWIEKLNSRTEAEVIIFEEGSISGGVGEGLLARLHHSKKRLFGIPDRFIEHGSPTELESQIGFSEKIISDLLSSDG